MKLALIMLAAGNSRRFGSNKLLYPIKGKAMYLFSLELLMQVKKEMEGKGLSCSVTVVTQYSEIEKNAVRMGAEVLYNDHPEDGISSSLKIGLKANQDADVCLFTVSDQPWLTKETVAGMIEAFLSSDKGTACLWSEGKPGNPCIFSKPYYPELLALKGDTGGRKVMKAHADDVLLFKVTDSRQLEDLDTCPKRFP